MKEKTIQQLKENFYILLEKYIQKEKALTGREECPRKEVILNLFLNETERYIGGTFDYSRVFSSREIKVLNYAHSLLFKMQKGEISTQQIYEDLKNFSVATKDFYDAVYEENSGEYEKLLGADKNINTSQYQSTPLINAINNANLKMVSDIIKMGADVNQPDKKGLKPLYHALVCRGIASGANHSTIVQFLINAGAKTTNLDGKGSSAQVLAIQNNRPRCLMMLMQQKKSTNEYIINEEGKKVSFANYAVQKSFYKSFQVLLAHGADIHAVDETGLSPFQTACKLKKEAFTELMNETSNTDVGLVGQSIKFESRNNPCKIVSASVSNNQNSQKQLISCRGDFQYLRD